MKIAETILAQLADIDTLLESVYQAIANVDPNYAKEMVAYEQTLQTLMQAVPDAEIYLQARRQEFASDIRFALWQGFRWAMDCHRDPVYKLMAQMDFEDLCQESKMHTLPTAQAAQDITRKFTQSLPEDQLVLLNPIIDHFAYIETYGYKLAHAVGIELAERLLGLVLSRSIL